MLSILTPLHKPYERYIRECYESFRAQEDWEWIVVENQGGELPPDIGQDARVQVVRIHTKEGDHNIGKLKALAVSRARGDIIVELDADDLLTPDALEEIRTAFSDPSVAMAYSNSAHFDAAWQSSGYSDYYGWRQRPFFYEGHELIEMVAFPCNAEMMRRIEWAPNHVRAWRRAAYEKVGGHNPALKVGDDHDLCCRFFIAYGPQAIRHIDRCLYLYRTHEANSCTLYNAEVQAQTDRNYLEYSRRIIIRQAQDDKRALLDLGGRLNAWPGFVTVDRFDADIITDLNETWPFADNSVGVLRASHIFEHLRDPVHAMNQAYRVLSPGGWLLLEVPSTDGRGAFQDPTHVSFWNVNCVTPETLVLCSDLTWRPASDLIPGQELIGFDEYPVDRSSPAKGRPRSSRHYRTSIVEANAPIDRHCYNVSTDMGCPVTASDDHGWLVQRHTDRYDHFVWTTTKELKVGDKLAHFAKPWDTERDWDAGWLAGMFDGEGCLSFSDHKETRLRNGSQVSLSVAQRESKTLERLGLALKARSFKFNKRRSIGAGEKECYSLFITGGRREVFRFLGTIRPPRFCERRFHLYYEDVHVKIGSTVEIATITRIEDAGVTRVNGVQTSTRTLITNGYLSHNSLWYYTDRNFARFIPEYKGRFQVARAVTWFPTEFEKTHNIAILQADLIALKGQRQAGEARI